MTRASLTCSPIQDLNQLQDATQEGEWASMGALVLPVELDSFDVPCTQSALLTANAVSLCPDVTEEKGLFTHGNQSRLFHYCAIEIPLSSE